MVPLRVVVLGSLVLVGAACGASERVRDGGGEAGGGYPVVTDPPPAHGETVTEPSGATSSRPLKPTAYDARPSASCERRPYRSASGDGLLVVPPRPGLTAIAVSARTVELSWRFEEVPSDCRPSGLLVSVVANDAPGATPTTVSVPYTGRTGATTVDYPGFLPPPDVALASAVTEGGARSRTARVLIRR